VEALQAVRTSIAHKYQADALLGLTNGVLSGLLRSQRLLGPPTHRPTLDLRDFDACFDSLVTGFLLPALRNQRFELRIYFAYYLGDGILLDGASIVDCEDKDATHQSFSGPFVIGMTSDALLAKDSDWREGRAIPGCEDNSGRPLSVCAAAFKEGKTAGWDSTDRVTPNYPTPGEDSVRSQAVCLLGADAPGALGVVAMSASASNCLDGLLPVLHNVAVGLELFLAIFAGAGRKDAKDAVAVRRDLALYFEQRFLSAAPPVHHLQGGKLRTTGLAEPTAAGLPATRSVAASAARTAAVIEPARTPRPRTVLVLGFGGFGKVAEICGAVRRRGLRPVAVVNSSHPWTGLEGLECVLVQNMFSADDVVETVRRGLGRVQLAGIVSQFDLLTFTYADLCARFDEVPHPPLEPLLRARVKHCLRKRAVGNPRLAWPYALARGPDDCSSAVDVVGLPCVAKPVGGAGSLAVRRCQTAEELRTHVERFVPERLADAAPGFSTQRVVVDDHEYCLGTDVLVEKELVGPELTVDGYSVDAVPRFLHTQDMVMTSSDGPFLDIGFVSPPVTVSRDALRDARGVLTETLASLDASDLIFHAELKVTEHGPRVVELNPRFGGGPIALLVRAFTGFDPVDAFVDWSLGRSFALAPETPPAGPRFRGYFTVFGEPGRRIREIRGLDVVTSLPTYARSVVATPLDAFVPRTVEKAYVQFLLFAADRAEDVLSSLNTARRTIRVAYVGDGIAS
jgi:hypothetical protein